LNEPKHFRADLADILFIGSALKHEFFSAVLVVLEKPSHSYHFLPCNILREPKINDDEYCDEFVYDKLAEECCEEPFEDEETDDDGF